VKIEFSDQAKSNLITFLDRVPVKGHKEISAMNEIMYFLTKAEITGNPKEKPVAETEG
jgi:hypothetical protein